MSYPSKRLIKAAEAGDPDAQYELGLIYSKLEDPRKSFHWLHEAMSNDHIKARKLLHAVIKKFLTHYSRKNCEK
jgi:TPR repeat protein